ncbi:MAG: hypothetical protein ISR82_07925 [Candidatus Marinimicrobia bacterium]|nr:hypothetical protein [Candidatus Neomarinimicrobiota bacterium]MBL7011136.1 hypothetical protein [Candidatus Neomarinimicrobiota bacterium]MBL7031292.1 hypothetical protein [Candidatus Neomarinimicrobiota bacterium]
MLLKKTITEVARNFSHLVNRVAYKHDSIILVRGNKEVAELRPVVSGLSSMDFVDFIKSLPHLTESELTSFSNDLKDVRESMNDKPIRDPWAS